MSQKIAIVSQKGGVGKTTVSLNLALAFAERGKPTLLVDLDPQGGVGHSLRKSDTELTGLVDLLMGEATPDGALVETKLPSLCLLPRGRLDSVDVCEYERAIGFDGVLANALAAYDERFELILLDTPSGLGSVTRAALAAADFALVPFQTEALAMRSVGQTLRVLEHVQNNENPELQLLGILPTMLDRQNKLAVSILTDVWTNLTGVLETSIPRDDVFAQASERGIPVAFLGGATSPEATRFHSLASETESVMARLTHDEEVPDEKRPERQLL